MPSVWGSAGREERGAYTSVAQTEDANVELTVHGKELQNGSLWVLLQLSRPLWLTKSQHCD